VEPLLGRSDSNAQRALIELTPVSEGATRALDWLAERALEEGTIEDATLFWRRAQRLAPDPKRAARLLWARARPASPPHRPGSVGRPGRAVGAATLLWAREAAGGLRGPPPVRGVSADDARVYYVGARSLQAVDRATGRLQWVVPGASAADDLLRAHGVLLQRSATGIRALDPRRGHVRWKRALADWNGGRALDAADRCVQVVALPQGFALLVVRGGRWEVVQLDPRGQVRWRTALWATSQEDLVPAPIGVTRQAPTGDPCRNPEDTKGECPSRDAFRGGVHPEKEVSPLRYGYTGPYRPLRDDGRLAAVGDRIVLTADGVIAALGAESGDLIWLRERSLGLGVAAGDSIRVTLRATAFAVEASTAAGLLVRLDPLDGSSLRSPRTRAGVPYRLATSPLVLAWATERAFELRAGLEGVSLGALDAPPVWDGASVGTALAIPTRGGLTIVDTRTAAPHRIVPWPLGPARVVAAAGLWLLVNERGVAALEPGGETSPAAVPSPLSPQHLADRSWRVRLAARTRLSARLARGEPGLGEALAALAKGDDLEARFAARELVADHGRRQRWRRIAPKASAERVEALVRGGDPAATRALIPDAARGPGAGSAAVALVLEASDLADRLALV
jgi:hypothetical protein